MKKVIIFSGTTEGRRLAKMFSKKGIYSDVCVATEYGSSVMEKSEYINILEGRKDILEMKRLYSENNYEAVIDATHPFAVVVSENIKESLEGTNIPYFRVSRERDKIYDNSIYFNSNEECISYLLKTTGNILLTTGSKELKKYSANENIKERIFARVIPGLESINICYDNGLLGKQIIAMQGPFSENMNMAIMQQYDIKYMVTKESGKTGGVDEKISAANKMKVTSLIIKRPDSDKEEKNYSIEEIYKLITNESANYLINVNLIGIGMGNENTLTLEAKALIEKSDYIFGAKRMVEKYAAKKKTFMLYKSDDIIPKLEELKGDLSKDIDASILFSGDTGFFSGSVKMYEALKNMEGIKVNIIPGISSLAAFSSKIGVSYHDAKIISAHGTDKNIWENEIINAAVHFEKTFFITSGYEDLNRIGELLTATSFKSDISEMKIYIGYNLSYENEIVKGVTPNELKMLKEKGLYVGMIINNNPTEKILSPHLKDEEFIRDKVPMTKEEIRHLSVCKLKLRENSVVYDIGSGTGSIAVEIANLSDKIKVYAVEINETALSLINENSKKFSRNNINVISGLAPECLENIEAPSHVFIGGSKGNMEDILLKLMSYNRELRVVSNAVTMESIYELQSLIKKYNFSDIDITNISINKVKTIGSYNMLMANNPVFIFAFTIPANCIENNCEAMEGSSNEKDI